jgi:hypothetical protein
MFTIRTIWSYQRNRESDAFRIFLLPVARLGIGQELADPERVADAYAMAARAL